MATPHPSQCFKQAPFAGLLAGASLCLLTACAVLAQGQKTKGQGTGNREQGTVGKQSPIANSQSAIENPKSKIQNRTSFWSFQSVKNPALPAVKNVAWCKNPIDRFILAGLEAKGLKPAAPADRRTLIRRASFDLTGLPPTPEDVEAFVKDKSPDAWEKVVNRLLDSPAYGERWGRHWLDLVRYADSLDARGSGSDGDISEAWRYRDWIVNAFNRDLPYNWFLKYQIAGDLLPEWSGSEQGTGNREQNSPTTNHQPPITINPDGIIATGLLAIGNWGNGDADKDKILTDIADDQVDVISRGMMGLTVACARCHDHKFDPISTKDYYGLAGIFFSTHILPKLSPKGAGESILRVSLDTPQAKARREAYQQELASSAAQVKQMRDNVLRDHARSLLPQTERYAQATWLYAHRPIGQATQTPEAFAASQNLQLWAFRQWNDFLKTGDYPLMLQSQADASGIKGVSAWRGAADCPNALINTNDTPRPLSSLTLPPRSVCVHPGPTNGVVVAWQSPITGTVQITGGVADADPNGGDGIAWALDQRSAGGARELATGEFPNGGKQDFAQGHTAANLKTVSVRQGDQIELAVLPKENYGFDTTVVDLTITEVGAANSTSPTASGTVLANINSLSQSGVKAMRAWNLARDLMADPLQGGKGNPHTDSYGNAGVWRFEDMADRHRNATPDAVFNPDLALVRQAVADGSGTAAAIPANAQQAIQQFAHSFTAADASSPFWIQNPAEESQLSPEARAAIAKAQTQLDALRKSPPPPIAFANAAQEGGCPESPHAGVHDVRVHIRGSYARLGDMVPRHFPVVIAGENQPPITQGSGRLQLAEWLASDTHPLTGRVWVNRVWQHHFGKGIVGTPSNFGFLGEKPTHPELLDWLASHFVEGSGVRGQGSGKDTQVSGFRSQVSGKTFQSASPDTWNLKPDTFACSWSTKKLHRLILLSATYQQASEGRAETVKADPDNRLVGRMMRQRLEAEAVRDSLLAASGKLDKTMGGVAYRDFTVPRRTLYYMTIRSDRAGFAPLFDGADSTACVDRRTVSTVAPQSLYLLNNPFVLDQTRALAQRLATEIPDGPNSAIARIQRAYLLLYGRPAGEDETRIAQSFLQRARATAKDSAAWEQYCQILLCANEFVYVD